MKDVSILETFERIVQLSRVDRKPASAMGLKLMEEIGEFAEAINFKLGYLPHKQLKESPIGEAADVIQNVVCILGALYPELSTERLLAELAEQLNKKTDKWESVMEKVQL